MASQVSQAVKEPNETMVDATEQSIKKTDQTLFRQDAVDAYIKGVGSEGTVFEAEPSWIKASYLMLLAGAIGLLLFVMLGRVNQYATGPVLIHIGKQLEVTAAIDANVGKILVTPGDEVTAGQPILQLHQAQAIADYQRLKNEFDLRLRQRLMAPDDKAVESALIGLHADMDQAKTKIDQRLVHAEIDGIVGDIRIRPGQRVTVGQLLMSLTNNTSKASVVALLPGQYRPQLQPGMQLQLTLDGYPYNIQYLTIDAIADEIIGPAEIRQFLGNVVADGLDIQGANFIVEARLDDTRFISEDQEYAYHHGMQGTAEVKVLSESVLVSLFPALKKIF